MADTTRMIRLEVPEDAITTPECLGVLQRDFLPTLPTAVRQNVETQIKNQLHDRWPGGGMTGGNQVPRVAGQDTTTASRR